MSVSAEAHAAVGRPLASYLRLPRDPRIGWVPYAWLLYLGTLYLPVLASPLPRWPMAVAVAVTVVFLPLYFRSYWAGDRELRGLAVAVLLLGVLASPVNSGASVLFVYAGAMAARQRRRRVALVGVALVTLAGVVAALAFRAPLFYWVSAVVWTPFIGLISAHATQVEVGDERLRLARAEVERLAAIAERERIARDLHDVLGHSLTLIVRKAELAARLSDRDIAAARREMLELEAISRSALSDVREAIQGYRASWPSELERANRLLASAGVTLLVDGAPDAPAREVEEALALALREGATNVARHAQATRCEVRWESRPDAYALCIRDDGIGTAGHEGLGLRGIRERAAALGGSVDLRRLGRGTELCVAVPRSRA